MSCEQSSHSESPNSTSQNDDIIIEQIKPILKRKSLDGTEGRIPPSILKKRDSFDAIKSDSHSILKRHSLGSENESRSPSLLIASVSPSGSGLQFVKSSGNASHVHPILKHRSLDEQSTSHKEDQTLMPKPILKKKWSLEGPIERCTQYENNANNKTKSILKSDNEKRPQVRGILKVPHTQPKDSWRPVKSALKKSDQTSDSNKQEVKSILKPGSVGSSGANTSDSSSSSDEDSSDEFEFERYDTADEERTSESKTVVIEHMSEDLSNLNVNHQKGERTDDNKRTNLERHNSEKYNKMSITSNNELHTPVGLMKSATQPIYSGNECVLSAKRFGNSSGDKISFLKETLKQNGEEMWKKRMQKPSDDDESEVVLRVPAINRNSNRSSIADRLSALERCSDQWKGRVEQKDVLQFTVAGKMKHSIAPNISKTPEITKRTPKAVPFRSQTTATMPHTNGDHKNDKQLSSQPLLPSINVNPPQEAVNGAKSNASDGVVITIPKTDDDSFNSFFPSLINTSSHDTNDCCDEQVFDDIFNERPRLLVQRKSVKPQTRRRPTAANPIKSLANTDIAVDSYVEANTATKVTPRKDESIPIPKPRKELGKALGKSSSFAVSALAGLASREDFKAVAGKLRSSTSSRDSWKTCEVANSSQSLMLIQVKGRRRAQCRLVEPLITSINSGDCYILVQRDRIYVWFGEFCNIIERTKTLEVANQIQKKKDLCFRSSNAAVIIDHQNKKADTVDKNKTFIKLLTNNDNAEDVVIKAPESPDEDLCYEEAIIGTNMVYRVNNEELIPVESCWGRVPRFELLRSDECYVFDFGSEMYFWLGKVSTEQKRKYAYELAKGLWNRGYNYSECDINPLGLSAEVQCKARPRWTWFMKVNQNMETILFKDKFLNWPSISRNDNISNEADKQNSILDFPPLDAKLLINNKLSEPDIVLENAHLGRGVRWDDSQEGTHDVITTSDVKCWHVSEYDKRELPSQDFCYFYSGETYVIRWRYRISRVGRQLKTGNVSKHAMIGRDRCCYFFWHGFNSKITEKGASALMTIELDSEGAQQVRVSEGKEEPYFLNLFKGGLVIARGKRAQQSMNECKMFYVKGVYPNEVCLIEVERKAQNLRSRTSFAFINGSKNAIYVWHGCKSLKETRQVMNYAVENLITNKSNEIGLSSSMDYSIKEFEEGKETKEFWDIIEIHGRKQYRQLYYSLLDRTEEYTHTPRLFNFTSTSGRLEWNEISCPYRSTEHAVPYPFTQEDLYSAQQPTFFLFDNEYELFLWESKFPFPDQSCEMTESNITTGSANIRWNAERKCVLDVVLSYCHSKKPEEPPNAYVISAGLEPECFTNLFPQWNYREDVAILHIEDGRKPGELLYIQEVVAQLRNNRSSSYKLVELQKRPIPEGLNPLCLESYLDEKGFEEAFGMERQEFYALPTWKQRSLKQRSLLF